VTIGLLGLLRKARLEGEDVLVEHAVEEPDQGVAVLHDQVILLTATAGRCEAELLVEGAGHVKIFHREADRKGS
jgi:hypothetical protein